MSKIEEGPMLSEEYIAEWRKWSRSIDKVNSEVKVERHKQDVKWNEQNHDPIWWMTILGEEFGESQKALLDATFGGKSWSEYRAELVQTAAVAVAAIQSFDRNGPPKPPKDKSKASSV